MKIHTTRIIGTDTIVFSAWEPLAGHRTQMTLDGERMGQVGARPLPAELGALPAMSDERAERVSAWHREQYAEAYAAIEDADPRARGGRYSMGEISITVPR